jgi:hypothetical protein
MGKWLVIVLAFIAGYAVCVAGLGKKVGLPG